MIKSSANKYKESSKMSWMKEQTKPVNGNRDVIETKVKLGSFSSDSVTRAVYNGHFPNRSVISAGKKSTKIIKGVENA